MSRLMKLKSRILITILAVVFTLGSTGSLAACSPSEGKELLTSYSFEDVRGSETYNDATGEYDKINYVFNAENAEYLMKAPSDPLVKDGVKGNSLYMDGMSVEVLDENFELPESTLTVSAFVAPRVFENLVNYSGTYAAEHTRLTSVINYGNLESGVGFVLGYGRLGMWGFQIAVYNRQKRKRTVVGFYDPINTLPLYEFSHIAATVDGQTGYVALFFNGKVAYEDIIPDLANCEIIDAAKKVPLRIGGFEAPADMFGIKRQFVGGLIDEVRVYASSFTPKRMSELYDSFKTNGEISQPDYGEVALDSSVYEGDRYRPQYHAIPPAMWMNEPHSPIYYKGRYHVFYQSNPSGPYWEQIRWGHIVSDDLVHWKYVKDAVVPTAGICPQGVWTGGAVVGPDGAPWLIITAGTNTHEGGTSGQNIAFAHALDPNDPDLTEFVLEETVTIAQKEGDAMGEVGQFRDPFCWYDDETEQYFMLISSSIPGGGGTANVYTSRNLHEWEYHGYFYECPYPKYDVAGIHWECVTFLPISTKDKSITKYVLFDTPQYASNKIMVESYYWVGRFDKENCRFIPDDDEPRLFDFGTGIFNGQTGLCYRTEEEIQSGMTYEEGRTIMLSIAQGKDAGTMHDYYSAWAHNFSFPVELWLSDDGTKVMRAPIEEIKYLEGETLYEYAGEGKTAAELDAEIAEVRGDCIKIEAKFTIDPEKTDYKARIGFRCNRTKQERTWLDFASGKAKIDRSESTALSGITNTSVHEYDYGETRTFCVTILLDRSMVETYINGEASGMMRVYPKYGDSDGLRLVDDGAGMIITEFTVTAMKSAFSENGEITDAYYGNVGE